MTDTALAILNSFVILAQGDEIELDVSVEQVEGRTEVFWLLFSTINLHKKRGTEIPNITHQRSFKDRSEHMQRTLLVLKRTEENTHMRKALTYFIFVVQGDF